ncbi:GDP-L-fucose synthase [Sporomusaceae bacterium BoRhaA]|uniref:NAD-dependent epimerase/dehydratase family protein n=1 Tax=Pelorhabdus rhamnosifermentans TaxID=2772457 RepID=UPI001C063DB8|nr:NAD-dependent epimerase/dehydratase family protein [Pelorhabdus rhamnosifermentans]MBU2703211.1 GDP-L-fucose synthase [Pelorhabdus rhamnosifermentans]
MKVLITGAGGFVGRNLEEYFSGKHEIFAATHADLDLLDDSAVKNYIEENQIEFIIHCASYGGSRKSNYDEKNDNVVEQNLRMFFNLERCLTPNMRMVYLGSGAEYDRLHWSHKMSEEYFDTYVPADSYGYAKYLISKYIEQTDNIVCLRIFGLFGKYEDYRFKFISNAIVKNLLKMPITINQNVVFDYLYIGDFVKLVKYMIGNKPKEKHYNITPTQSIDLVTIAEIINEISDFKSKIIVLYEGMNREYSGDNNKLLSEVGNFQFTEYVKSIEELYQYYSSIFDTLDVEIIKNDLFISKCLKR